MPSNYKNLEWDTDFFGYKIVQLLLTNTDIAKFNRLIAELKSNGVKLAYVYPEDEISKSTLHKKNVPLVDTKITFEKDLVTTKEFQTNFEEKVPYNENYNYEQLLNLAFESGKYSRFKLDQNFINREFEKLYKTWLDKSISKDIADDVLVYLDRNNITGFVSIKNDCDKLKIGLIAVDQNYQGKGIGKKLMQHVESIALAENLKKISVETQKQNDGAMAFYQSCGFSVVETKEIYHLWIK
jgi:dTDP-4-amino-4,6-dideoxy-D-galactose acyltransferase